MNINETNLAIAALIALLTAAPTVAAEDEPTYSPADTNQDCVIQFGEYTAARSAVLQDAGAFGDYTFARSALLNQDEGAGYGSAGQWGFTCSTVGNA